MSEFITEHEQIALQMEGKVDPIVFAGITGEGYDEKGGLSHDSVHSSPCGSNLFNAFTRACYRLQENPNANLSSEVIRPPEQLSTLGSYLVNLVNDTHTRNKLLPNNFVSKKINKLVLNEIDGCCDAEENFMKALGQENEGVPEVYPEHRLSKNKIYIDDDGQPLLIRKTYGEKNTLSLQDISINGVAFPAGTLFISRERALGHNHRQDKHLTIKSLRDISRLSPIRLTKYALPTEEQNLAVTREGLSPEFLAHCGQDTVFNLEELKSYLPEQSELKEIASNFPQAKQYNKSAWVPILSSV